MMTPEELESYFPDDYDSSPRQLTDIYELVNDSNMIQFCVIANQQYDYLLDHRQKHPFYIVNWRDNFARLEEFIKSVDFQQSDPAIIVIAYDFLDNYEHSGDELYIRFDDKDEE